MRVVINVASGSFSLIIRVGNVQGSENNARHAERYINTNGFKWSKNNECKDDGGYAARCSKRIIPRLFPVLNVGGKIGNDNGKEI